MKCLVQYYTLHYYVELYSVEFAHNIILSVSQELAHIMGCCVDLDDVSRRLPNNATALSLSLPYPDFTCKPGQYVLIQCDQLSSLEWHPFSVTKVPYPDSCTIELLIRAKGDWTGAFIELLSDNEKTEKTTTLLLDGPYSSSLERLLESDVVVCAAAGVGITPFMALLNQMLRNPEGIHPSRVHLVWTVRKECEILWMNELAVKTLLALVDSNRPDRFNLEIYVTRSKSTKALKSVETKTHLKKVCANENMKDSECETGDVEKATLICDKKHYFNVEHLHTIIKCRIKYGRPNWKYLFEYWIHFYPKMDVRLFCVGPKNFTQALRRQGVKHNKEGRSNIIVVN